MGRGGKPVRRRGHAVLQTREGRRLRRTREPASDAGSSPGSVRGRACLCGDLWLACFHSRCFSRSCLMGALRTGRALHRLRSRGRAIGPPAAPPPPPPLPPRPSPAQPGPLQTPGACRARTSSTCSVPAVTRACSGPAVPARTPPRSCFAPPSPRPGWAAPLPPAPASPASEGGALEVTTTSPLGFPSEPGEAGAPGWGGGQGQHRNVGTTTWARRVVALLVEAVLPA